MYRHHQFTCFAAALLFAATAPAQPQFHVISSIAGAASYTVAVKGDYLYSGEGNTMRVYDISPGATPPYDKVWERRLLSMIDDVIADGDVLWVCANTDGLYKYDVSTPGSPQELYAWRPDNLDEAVYDVAVKGDSVFVANKKKLSLLLDSGSGLQKLTDVVTVANNASRIRGCAVKSDVLAFTIATMSLIAGTSDGVHLYDATTLKPLSYVKENFGDHEEVIFGQETTLLHIMAGGQFTSSLPFPLSDARGHYFAIDVVDPMQPQVVFRDTIPGLTGIGDTQVIDGELQNDTLYLATRTGDDQIFPLDGNVFIYDCTDKTGISRITDIGVGLLHFDVALQGKILHVASEWFGVRSIDISNLLNPVDLGDTPTGGWCPSTDIVGDRMLQANEGYGLQVFDISDPTNPVLAAKHLNINNGFCYNARFSKDGQYVFGSYIEALTLDEFRVFDTETMEQVAALNFFVGYEHCRVYEDIFIGYALKFGSTDYISFTDVSDPLDPHMITTIPVDANDLEIDSDGRLFVASDDALRVYDVVSQQMLEQVFSGSDPYTSVTVAGDTIYAYKEIGGVEKLVWDDALGSLQLLTSLGPLPHGASTEFAADARAIYAGYTEFGLYALSTRDLSELDYFRTGLDFIFPWWWELEQLAVFGDFIAVTEYFGQTTLLSFSDTTLSVEPAGSALQRDIMISPNPTRGELHIVCQSEGRCCQGRMSVHTLTGEQVFAAPFAHQAQLDLATWPPGTYIAVFESDCGQSSVEKFMICR